MPESLLRRTYWQSPMYFPITAGWFRIVGVGVVQVRLLSILFGLLALVSWYWITRLLLGAATAGLIAMGLVSIDLFFVQGASFGRMDMVCGGFGSAALAAYIFLRERSLLLAMFWSHLFVTFAILTHPVGMLYWLGLLFLILRFDRRSLSVRIVLAGVAPAVTGAALWGLFILQDPKAFFEQMHAALDLITPAFADPDLSSNSIVRSLQLELRHRYIAPFGLGSGVAPVQRLKALVLAAYLIGIPGCLIFGKSRRKAGLTTLAVLALIAIFYLALASPSKYYYYLPHVCMFMAASLGGLLYQLGAGQKRNLIAGAVIFVLTGLQVAGQVTRIRQSPYTKSYLPVIEQIRQHTTPRSMIMGGGELWFGLEHDRYIINDFNLGALSGNVPDVFIMNPLYRDLHQSSQTKDPSIYRHVEQLLDSSRLIYTNGDYQVYLR